MRATELVIVALILAIAANIAACSKRAERIIPEPAQVGPFGAPRR